MTTEQFKLIYERLGKDTAKKMLDEEPADFLRVQLLTSVLRQISYYIADDEVLMSLQKQIKKRLHIDKLVKATDVGLICQYLSVYSAVFMQYKTDYDAELHEFVTQWLFGNYIENFESAHAF